MYGIDKINKKIQVFWYFGNKYPNKCGILIN